MSPASIVAISMALAMDAFAVAIASGAAMRKLHIRHAFIIACWFGGFQALMPALGWLSGVKLVHFFAAWDHWVAFWVLAFIGAKMIHEAAQMEKAEKEASSMRMGILFSLAVATSVDALAVGFSLALLNVAVLVPIVSIGVITFMMSFAGVCLGNTARHFFETWIEVLAGIVLIVIGFRILFSHIM